MTLWHSYCAEWDLDHEYSIVCRERTSKTMKTRKGLLVKQCCGYSCCAGFKPEHVRICN